MSIDLRKKLKILTMLYDSGSQIIHASEFLEILLKCRLLGLILKVIDSESEVGPKNSHFQQIPGDVSTAVLGSTLRTTLHKTV